MNIEGPYLGQLDASFSARRDHLGATPEESATRCSTGRAQVARSSYVKPPGQKSLCGVTADDLLVRLRVEDEVLVDLAGDVAF